MQDLTKTKIWHKIAAGMSLDNKPELIITSNHTVFDKLFLCTCIIHKKSVVMTIKATKYLNYEVS